MFYNINAWKSDCSIVGIVFIVFIVGIGRVGCVAETGVGVLVGFAHLGE